MGITSGAETPDQPVVIQLTPEKPEVEKNMFFGKLYMGSKFVETDVIYDTMQDSVSVVKIDAAGEWNGSKSMYDFLDDDTEVIQEYVTYENDEPEWREK